MNDKQASADSFASGVDGSVSVPQHAVESDLATRIVPVIEEHIQVQKHVVDQGGYRLSKKVSIRHETVDEPLISRSVQVERRTIGRLLPTMESPPTRQEGTTLIISVVEEVLVTEKRLMLKEEIHVTQTDVAIHKPVNVALRSEEVLIEPLEPHGPTGSTNF